MNLKCKFFYEGFHRIQTREGEERHILESMVESVPTLRKKIVLATEISSTKNIFPVHLSIKY